MLGHGGEQRIRHITLKIGVIIMLNKKTNPFQLRTLAVAIGFIVTASAYAGNDHGSDHTEKNDSNSVEIHSKHVDSKGGNHVENHGKSTSSNKSFFKSNLTAGVEPLAQGEIKLEQKTSKTEFSAEVKIPVPSTALGVTDTAAANNATLFLVLRDNLGVDYAECHLDLNKTKTVTNRGVSSLIAEYEVKVSNRNGFLQASVGVCDVDLTTTGIQVGVPLIHYGDSAEVTVDTNNAIVGIGRF